MLFAISNASSIECAVPNSGASIFNSVKILPNFLLFSARSIASGSVPIIFTPSDFSLCAILRGVWPPNCTSTPSGFSMSIIFITSSNVSGSKYSRSEISKSVDTVSGLQFTIIVLYPISFNPKTA